MKKFTWVAVFACISVFASEKVYLNPEQIALSDRTIYINLEGEMVEIDQLLVDQAGIYFMEENARCIECRKPLNPKNTCHKRLNPKNTCNR